MSRMRKSLEEIDRCVQSKGGKPINTAEKVLFYGGFVEALRSLSEIIKSSSGNDEFSKNFLDFVAECSSEYQSAVLEAYQKHLERN